jgi:hypothetical protein
MARGKTKARRTRKAAPVDEMAKYRKKFVWDSKKKKLVEVKRPLPVTHGITKWPIHSDSMGVNPNQREALIAHLASQGVRCEVDAAGRPILTDPAHRRAVAEARGFYDRNGGYSDPQRK